MGTETRAVARPIIFSAPLVRAVLDGRKTQTRRVVRPQPHPTCSEGAVGWHWHPGGREDHFLWSGNPDGLARQMAEWCPYGGPGDRLWVRESAFIAPPDFGLPADGNTRDDRGRLRVVGYAASMCGDAVRCATDYGVRKTPSIFMPRWASRVTLALAAVRVERLGAISEADARAEGAGSAADFARLWDDLNGKRPGCGWDADPWVWVLTFRREMP